MSTDVAINQSTLDAVNFWLMSLRNMLRVWAKWDAAATPYTGSCGHRYAKCLAETQRIACIRASYSRDQLRASFQTEPKHNVCWVLVSKCRKSFICNILATGLVPLSRGGLGICCTISGCGLWARRISNARSSHSSCRRKQFEHLGIFSSHWAM